MKKYLTLVGLLGLVEIGLVLYLTYWREIFWNYVAGKDFQGFALYLGIFTGVALCICVVVATANYCNSRAAIKWRERLNAKAHLLKRSNIENVNQRIQEDCSKYPDLVLQIGGGVIKALIYVIVFSVALALKFSWVYLVLIIAYALIATGVARAIGNPLINLNYKLQQVEATYRNRLSQANFKQCILTQINIAKKLKHLQYFQSLYGQLGVIIPLLILAPDFFATAMTLGSLMQANSIMGTITDNLSYGVNNFDVLNKLLSCRKRLKEINII